MSNRRERPDRSCGNKHSARMKAAGLVVFLSLLVFMVSAVTVSADPGAPTRVINLVYDDSGSMINTGGSNGKYVDTWCQAKYAVEVFAGMLGENDTMNIYVMSDFEDKATGGPILKLSGKSGAKSNIEAVHKMKTTDGQTPFNSVKAAGEALKKEKADEKWLVVLTDGAFENGELPQKEIDGYFGKLPEDINVMFLGMGPYAGSIKANNKNIFYEKAENSGKILQKLTDIGTQVFNRDRLKVSGNNVTFDIPMKELIVFAQGKNVNIGGIKGKDASFTSDGEPVTVQYTKKENATKSNHYETNKIIEDTSLKGSMATFTGPIPEGTYKVDVTGAKTVEVYYQPDVDVIATLSKDGKPVKDMTDLEAGDYTIDFDIVKAGTTESVGNSELLGGDVSYEAVVNNNGNTLEGVKKGDTITIEEGPLSIDATAHYLDYHTVQTHLDYSIYKNKDLKFEVISDNKHELTRKGFAKDDQPTQVQVTVDGRTPTEEEWNEMDVPSVTRNKSAKGPELEFKAEKSDTPGVYNVWPVSPKKIKGKEYQSTPVNMNYKGKSGSATWKGKGKVTIPIDDTRSWIEINRDLLILLLILAAILVLALGYVPGIKHYLPKKLKKRPIVRSKIVGSYMKPPKPTNGDYQKQLATTLIPYVAEKGTIRYVPKGIAGAPKLQVKGSKGGRMEITNIRDFGKKKNIQFDGERADRLIEDMGNKRKFIASSGLMMTAEINGVKYTCSLNE